MESKGFADAPRFLGIGVDGREILSYVAGHTPLPPGENADVLTDPRLLASVAAFLRDLAFVQEELTELSASARADRRRGT